MASSVSGPRPRRRQTLPLRAWGHRLRRPRQAASIAGVSSIPGQHALRKGGGRPGGRPLASDRHHGDGECRRGGEAPGPCIAISTALAGEGARVVGPRIAGRSFGEPRTQEEVRRLAGGVPSGPDRQPVQDPSRRMVRVESNSRARDPPSRPMIAGAAGRPRPQVETAARLRVGAWIRDDAAGFVPSGHSGVVQSSNPGADCRESRQFAGTRGRSGMRFVESAGPGKSRPVATPASATRDRPAAGPRWCA